MGAGDLDEVGPGRLLADPAGRAKRWGLLWLAVSVALSLLTLPLTIMQLQALFGFGARPIRLDFLVYLWALVPWFYRKADPFDFLRPATWRAWVADARGRDSDGRLRADRASGAVRQRGVPRDALVDRPQQQRPDDVETAGHRERESRSAVRARSNSRSRR